MNDPEIRTLLRAHLRPACDALIIDELGILQGTVRADVVLVNDMLHGFEIKSATDSRTRLARQAAAYSRVFERCTVVAEANHLRGVLATLPEWWGVLVADETGLHEHRAGQVHEPEARAVAELLWAEEVTDLLAARRAVRGFRGKPRWVLWDRLCEVYSRDEIREHARAALRRRHAGGVRHTAPPMLREASR